jgi:hypothetical protein
MKSIRVRTTLGSLLAFTVAACSSQPAGSVSTGKTSTAPTSKGGSVTTAAEAVMRGQKIGKNAKASEAKARQAGATIGGGTKQRGGPSKGPADAQAAGLKLAPDGKLAASRGGAEDKGTDFDQATCDASFEAVGFCADDTRAVFCDGGHWWSLDCSTAAQGTSCGEDSAAHAVDCYAETDVEEAGPVVTCDASAEGTAWCADAAHAVFCDGEHWYTLACEDVVAGASCAEADDIAAVDCVPDGTAIERD